MKKNKVLKVLSALALAACVCAFAAVFASCKGEGYDCPEDPYDYLVRLPYGSEELIGYAENAPKYPEDFAAADMVGYGRVISSSSSAEEAVAAAMEEFTSDSCYVSRCELEEEGDVFYAVYVKWTERCPDSGNAPAVYDECVVSFKKEVYDNDGDIFYTRDAAAIRRVMDYIQYADICDTSGFKLYSSVLENDGGFAYTACLIERVYGDWGLMDEISLVEYTFRIDGLTGKVAAEGGEILGRAYAEGPFTNGGVVDG